LGTLNLPEVGENVFRLVLKKSAYLNEEKLKGLQPLRSSNCKKGEKVCVGLMVISQRPSDIDTTILQTVDHFAMA
jgi:hypothetical protein